MVPAHEQRIVVGIDGSPESSAALQWALKEAITTEAAVEVVHCYLPQTLTDAGFSTPRELHAASMLILSDEVAAALQVMPQHPEVQQSSLSGRPAELLLERSKDASMLVLGVHRQTTLRDRILGHVASTCLRRARRPVVVVGLDQSVDRHEAPSPV